MTVRTKRQTPTLKACTIDLAAEDSDKEDDFVDHIKPVKVGFFLMPLTDFILLRPSSPRLPTLPRADSVLLKV